MTEKMPALPYVIWSGTTDDPSSDEVEKPRWHRKKVMARVVVTESRTYIRGRNDNGPQYTMTFEIEDGLDMMKVQRWRVFDHPFPEFISDAAEFYLLKGVKP